MYWLVLNIEFTSTAASYDAAILAAGAMVEASIMSHRHGRRMLLGEILTADMLRQAGLSS